MLSSKGAHSVNHHPLSRFNRLRICGKCFHENEAENRSRLYHANQSDRGLRTAATQKSNRAHADIPDYKDAGTGKMYCSNKKDWIIAKCTIRPCSKKRLVLIPTIDTRHVPRINFPSP